MDLNAILGTLLTLALVGMLIYLWFRMDRSPRPRKQRSRRWE